MQIPCIIEATLSDTILRKRVSDLGGMMLAVLILPVILIETTNEPIFSIPSVIEIKCPLSNGTICRIKSR